MTIIVPYPKGGPADKIADLIVPPLGERLGRAIKVLNVPGRGGTKGALQAASSTADGSVLVIGNVGTHASAPELYRNNLRYDPQNDFTPVAMLSSAPVYLVSKAPGAVADLPPTFQELLTVLRSSPGRYIIGHGGYGSTSHLAAVYFMQVTKCELLLLTYRGSGPALRDLHDGVFDLMCEQSIAVADDLKAGTFRAYVCSCNTASMPEWELKPPVQIASQAGIPEFNIEAWNILFAPRGLPADHLQKLNGAVCEVLSLPEVAGPLRRSGSRLLPVERNTPEQLARLVRQEVRRWAAVVRIARLSGDDSEDDLSGT